LNKFSGGSKNRDTLFPFPAKFQGVFIISKHVLQKFFFPRAFQASLKFKIELFSRAFEGFQGLGLTISFIAFHSSFWIVRVPDKPCSFSSDLPLITNTAFTNPQIANTRTMYQKHITAVQRLGYWENLSKEI